jgi:hypothetical protein
MEILIRLVRLHARRALSFDWLIGRIIRKKTASIVRLLVRSLTKKTSVGSVSFATRGNLSRQAALVDFYQSIANSCGNFRALDFQHVGRILAVWSIVHVLTTKADFEGKQVVLLVLIGKCLSFSKHFLLCLFWHGRPGLFYSC